MTISVRKATWLASLGAGLEYYDFIIYGMMVSYLNILFFTNNESWIGQMKAFGVFAIGYLIRPFGGVLFGVIGDTFGRKKTFLSVMFIMAAGTLAIGCLPTYAQIGWTASLLLILFRLIQGISFGAELPGAITVVNEYADQKNRGLFSGFVISSVSIGSILASLILFLLTKSIDKTQILAWGWRIPFLLGGLLAVANYFIRKYLQETPAFTSLHAKRSSRSLKEPLIELLRDHSEAAAAGLGMTVFVSSLVVFSLYLPTYLTTHFSYAASDIFLAMTYGMIWSAITLPLSGYLADRWGRMTLFLIGCLGFIILSFPLFHLLQLGSLTSLIFFNLIYQTIISLLMASYFPLLVYAFPTSVRYTGIAFCYNIIYALMGCAPILLTFLIQKTSPTSAIWFLMICALISALSGRWLTKIKRVSTK